MNRAHAGPSPGGPSKFLSILIPGGVCWEQIFCAFSDAGIAKFIPAPESGPMGPWFFNAGMMGNYDGTDDPGGEYTKIRGPIHWNWANPKDTTTPNPKSDGAQPYWSLGHSWASRELTPQAVCERAVMIHGIDVGTAAHQSGIISGLCGVAGGDFRAPAIAAVIANAMMAPFPDRVLPSVSIGGRPVPKILSTTTFPISNAVSPIFLTSAEGAEYTISDHPDSAWEGLRERHEIDELGFDGAPTGRKLPVTVVEENVLKAVRAQRGRSSAGADVFLDELYQSYSGISRALASDVVARLDQTKGVEFLTAPVPWRPQGTGANFSYRLNTSGGAEHAWDGTIDSALKLLKSDLATSVSMNMAGTLQYNFDTHSGATASANHINNLRGTFEIIGQLILEMMLTPATTMPGKSLLDETVVHIFSDFGRTTSGTAGTDHHPVTTMILAGGGIQGNRMIGGYDESAKRSPLGKPVELINIEEGNGSTTTRVPTSQDAAATVYRAFGLEAGKDFFIPGGYAEVKGVVT